MIKYAHLCIDDMQELKELEELNNDKSKVILRESIAIDKTGSAYSTLKYDDRSDKKSDPEKDCSPFRV